ncbi:hypothetical protein GOQ30_03505 [Flavobacterium sp. TP390]|uniref:Phage abortive infection protein n=1 Tax=Flavobacterium profundi TaxID=1774945 RepID=A0A6I4IFE4_9FLAO|nr:putative phage abortive infection protein [Flavobacterium profundi]MVO08230.1 hypothetical protein [Flavobacterium profundi]
MKLVENILSLIAVISFGSAIYLIFMNATSNKTKYSKIIIVSLILLALSLVILVFTIDYLGDVYNKPQAFKKDFKEIGAYGDFFGGILNPILAFIGIIAASLAFYMQYEANRQVQLQFEEQKDGDYIQNFENNFYKLLSIHHQIIQDMDFYLNSIYKIKGADYSYLFSKNDFIFRNEEKITKSRDVFKNSFRLLHLFLLIEVRRTSKKNKKNVEIYNNIKKFPTIKIMNKKQEINTSFNYIYNLFYKKYDTDYGHYYRNLYRLIKIVDEKKFSNNIIEDYKIKYSYTSIIRAQLSDAEINWLFLNCLSDKGYKKFKPLVEKYSLLKIINLNDEVFNFFSKFYLDSAFNNPTSNSFIKIHLETDFYNNDVFIPFYNL